MANHHWASCANGSIPALAVVAGHDSDGDAIYIGRAEYAGDLLPCKVIPNKAKAYVSFDGKEFEVCSYEVLTGSRYYWIPATNGHIPPAAVKIGRTTDGDILFAGRGHYDGSVTVGKVHPSHGCLYIPYDGEEVKLNEYEVLALPEQWIPATTYFMPEDALEAGYDADGDIIYVGRVRKDGDLMPAKVIPKKGGAYAAYGGKEHKVENFEVLVGAGFMWIHSKNGNIELGAVAAGKTSNGETLYIGRANHEGSVCIGKVHPSHGCLYLPYGGGEVKVESYEILVRS